MPVKRQLAKKGYQQMLGGTFKPVALVEPVIDSTYFRKMEISTTLPINDGKMKSKAHLTMAIKWGQSLCAFLGLILRQQDQIHW